MLAACSMLGTTPIARPSTVDFYVWDGSIVPRPLGVDPLLTISALAERGSHSWPKSAVDDELPRCPQLTSRAKAPSPPTIPGPVRALGLAETMAGFRSTSTVAGLCPPTLRLQRSAGSRAASASSFRSRCRQADVEAVIRDPAVAMDVRGTVTWNDGATETQGLSKQESFG